jgi:multisubunit Na+/H+ antiporter MnhG subunit
MPNWYTRLRELVWPAVLAAGFAVLSVGTAFLGSENLSKTLALGLAGITMALLATRE